MNSMLPASCTQNAIRPAPPDPESDAALVFRAKQNPAAFAALYERYQDDVLRYAFHRLGHWEDAADVTQQTFVNALGGLGAFEDRDDSFRSWLFRIARNEVIDLCRRQARLREHGLQIADWVADPGSSLEEMAIVADERAVTRALMLQLPRGQRECCELRSSGLSHRETAVLLGRSEVSVRASYSRGLVSLRHLLSSCESGSTKSMRLLPAS